MNSFINIPVSNLLLINWLWVDNASPTEHIPKSLPDFVKEVTIKKQVIFMPNQNC